MDKLFLDSSLLVFGPGERTKTFTVPIANDTADEPSEAIKLRLTSALDAALGAPRNEITLTILDDDPPPTVGFDIRSINADEGQGSVTITVRLSFASESDVSVNYLPAGGTARQGEDYDAFSGTIVFSPGQMVQTFTVPLIDDGDPEQPETIAVKLRSPRGAKLKRGSQSLLIHLLDNDG
jgi:hypothetical protein